MIGGRLCGEVEVQTDNADKPGLLVYMAAAPGGGFEVVQVVENDADLAIDWYDNPMHQAFTELSSEGSGGQDRGSDTAALASQVLAFGSVREQLARAVER